MRSKIGEVTLTLSLNTKKPLKSGKYAVYIRVQYRSKNQYYSLRHEMSCKEWNRYEKHPETTHPVTKGFRTFENAVTKLIADDAFNFANLSQMTERSRKNTIQELFQNKIDRLKKAKKHSTASLYNTTLSSVNGFLKSENTPVGRLTADDCQGFVTYLQQELGNNPTTVSMKLRSLNAILEEAIKAKMISRNPLANIRKHGWKRRNLAVAPETLQRLLTVTKEEIGERRFHWLCFWRSIYFGNGMNVQDLLRLTHRNINIKTGEIIFRRRKTLETSDREVHVVIIPELMAALQEISGGKEYIIPILDGVEKDSEEEFKIIHQTTHNINTNLRKICKSLGIPEHIITSTGRHAFATTLIQNGIPIEFVSDALGHQSIRTTQNYLDGYTPQQRRQNIAPLKPKQ